LEIKDKLDELISEFQIELEADSLEKTYLKIGSNQMPAQKCEQAEELLDKIASISTEYGSTDGKGCIMAVQKIVDEITKLKESKEEISRRISKNQQQ